MGLQLLLKDVILIDVSKLELPDKADELDQEIQQYRDRLMILAGSTPRDDVDEDGNVISWLDHIQYEVSQALEGLREAYVTRHLVGVAINNPEDVEESY